MSDYEKKELSILEILSIIKHNLLIIIPIIIVFLALGMFYGYFYTPKYYSSTAMLVINISDDNTDKGGSMTEYTKFMYATYLPQAVQKLIQENPTILEMANQTLKDKGFTESIRGNISFNINEQNPIFSVKYKTTLGKNESAEGLNAILKATQDYVNEVGYSILSDKIIVLYSPTEHDVIVSQEVLKYTAIGLVAGIILSALIVIIRYLSDDTFKDREEVEKFTHTDVLAFVMYKSGDNFENKSKSRRKE